MEQSLQAVIEALAGQHTKFLIAYGIVFLAIVLNSIFVQIHAKHRKFVSAVVLLAENGLLCISLLLFCIIQVLIVDAAGQEFYYKYSGMTNLCLGLCFIGAVLCVIDLVILIICRLRCK